MHARSRKLWKSPAKWPEHSLCPTWKKVSRFSTSSVVFDSWVNFDKFVGRNDAGGNFPFASGGGAPYLNRETGELSPGHGKNYWVDYCGGFEGCWRVLPGARNEIDLASLPKLKKLKMPEESKPAPKATPAPTPSAEIPQQQPNAINFSWIAPKTHDDICTAAELSRRLNEPKG